MVQSRRRAAQDLSGDAAGRVPNRNAAPGVTSNAVVGGHNRVHPPRTDCLPRRATRLGTVVTGAVGCARPHGRFIIRLLAVRRLPVAASRTEVTRGASPLNWRKGL